MRPFSIVLLSILSTLTSGCLYRRETAHFTYTGTTGPLVWRHLVPEFEICGKGTHQSPIDVLAGKNTKVARKLRLNYPRHSEKVTVENNGHTVLFTPENAGMEGDYDAVLQGKDYKLLQFHFHTPSEHLLNHTTYPLEVHFVHQDKSGKLAVVGMLFDLDPAFGDPFLGSVTPFIRNLTEKGTSTDIDGVAFSSIMKHINRSTTKILTYSGSLTTPPCTEGVTWYVVEKPKSISPREYSVWRNILKFNARYVQNDPGYPNLLEYNPEKEKDKAH